MARLRTPGRRVGPALGHLVLVRHGESRANAAGIFTGVIDSPLSARGIAEAHDAAGLLREEHVVPDAVLTSALFRAIETARILTQDCGWDAPVLDWRLNERNYGALTGLSKAEVRERYGTDRFLAWRRSVRVTPPPMTAEQHARFAAETPWRDLPPDALTLTESLADVMLRVRECWGERILPLLRAEQTVVVVAHGNSLRALCALIDQLPDPAVERLNIPTAQPLVYDIFGNGRPLVAGGRYLDPDRALVAAETITREGGT